MLFVYVLTPDGVERAGGSEQDLRIGAENLRQYASEITFTAPNVSRVCRSGGQGIVKSLIFALCYTVLPPNEALRTRGRRVWFDRPTEWSRGCGFVSSRGAFLGSGDVRGSTQAASTCHHHDESACCARANPSDLSHNFASFEWSRPMGYCAICQGEKNTSPSVVGSGWLSGDWLNVMN